MKKFLILWWMPGYGDSTIIHHWTTRSESDETAKDELHRRFDEMFVKCRREYIIQEVAEFSPYASYDTRKAVA